MLTLVQTNELEVEINMPENKIADAAIGQSVTVDFWALNGSVEGTIREVAPMADTTSRTYKVRVAIPNPPEGMQLGMTASVRLGSDNAAGSEAPADTAVLPLAAIYQNDDTPAVWLVGDDNTISLQKVEVKEFGDNKVMVYGLKPTDVVIIAGVHKLHEGETVRTEADEP